MKPTLESFYPKLPVFLQNVGCSYYGWRKSRNLYGLTFNKVLDDLIKSENWSKTEIEAYQREKLQKLIGHAYAYVPYYRHMMKKRNLKPVDIKNRDDLKKLPILTKEDVRSNIDALISVQSNKKKLLNMHTSGTTGKALSFYTSRESETMKSAVWWRHRMRYGLHYDDWHINFTGKIAVPVNQEKPPYWRWSYPLKQAIINTQHITQGKIGEIINFLNDTDCKFYVGYPSIIHSLASTAVENNQKLYNQPKVISLGAENATKHQIKDIKMFTTATLTEHYGSVEGCGSASYCTHNVFHEDFEYGILECVDPEYLDDGSIRGKIVCTGFANYDFPFIRYEIGDIGTWQDNNVACGCGLQSNIILHIDGRMDDYVITPEGRKSKDLEYVFQDTHNVRDAQIIQKKQHELLIKIVKRNEYSSEDEDIIREGISRLVSPQLEVYFEYVNKIEKEPNGKQRFVKSYLSKKDTEKLINDY